MDSKIKLYKDIETVISVMVREMIIRSVEACVEGWISVMQCSQVGQIKAYLVRYLTFLSEEPKMRSVFLQIWSVF